MYNNMSRDQNGSIDLSKEIFSLKAQAAYAHIQYAHQYITAQEYIHFIDVQHVWLYSISVSVLYMCPSMRVSNYGVNCATGCCSCLQSSPFSPASDLMTSNLSPGKKKQKVNVL